MRDEGKIITEQRVYDRGGERRRVARKANSQPGKSVIFKITIAVLFLSCLFWAWSKITNPQTFPIHSVKITGNYPHLDHDLLRQTIIPFIQNGFVNLDSSGLNDRLAQLPWVYSASVQRQWPDTLLIQITEQNPVAQFGKNTLLNAQGDLFTVDPKTIPSNLPVFVGQVGQQQTMLASYQQMQKLLDPLKLKITTLVMDTRGSWQLELSNGIIVYIDNNNPLVRLQRFEKMYQQIIGNNASQIKTVDLRYSNGMAVGYRDNVTH